MKALRIVLISLSVIALGYLCVMSIVTPERFKEIQAQREELIAKRLKTITSYELAYRQTHGRFANAEELLEFLKNGQIYYINAEGDYTDEMREKGMSEQDAAQKGLIRRDTMYVSARDSLLKNNEDPDEMLMIPGVTPRTRIEIESALIDQKIGNDTVKVSVFRAQVPMEIYLADQDRNILNEKIMLAKERNEGAGYPGLRIGSLEEVKTTGNWE